jgi:hypothetical protein
MPAKNPPKMIDLGVGFCHDEIERFAQRSRQTGRLEAIQRESMPVVSIANFAASRGRAAATILLSILSPMGLGGAPTSL